MKERPLRLRRASLLLSVVLAWLHPGIPGLAAARDGSSPATSDHAGTAGTLAEGLRESSSTPLIDLEVHDLSVSALIALLRSRHCAAVSFVLAAGPQNLSLHTQHAPIDAILGEVAHRLPAYRFERIDGRAVLYPSASDYQAVVDDVAISKTPRFAATDQYILLLRHRLASFSTLALPSMVGSVLGDSPFHREPVSVRGKGRVIDQLMDLLGRNARMYLGIRRAPTGVPAFEFGRIECPPSVPRIDFLPCSAGGQPPGGALDRVVSIDADGEPLAALLDRLRSPGGVAVSSIDGSSTDRVTVHLHDGTLMEVVAAILAQVPIRCLSGSGHVILLPKDPAYEQRLHAAKVEWSTPWMTANEYASQLKKTPGFRDLEPYVERPSDPALLNAEVALSPEGSVIEHLVQLLGNDAQSYFVVKRSADGHRSLRLGRVP